MMAAIAAAKNGHQVILYEKNEKLGKKIFITGKGRCNVTNACDTEAFFANVMSNPKFLYSAVYGFDAFQTMSFFEEAGCRLKTERGERVFPVSDHSSDVIKALQKKMDSLGITVLFQNEVKKVLTEKETVTGVLLAGGKAEACDAVIVATGGISYESTGSTGDGYLFAEQTGHRLVERRPSLVPLNCAESFCKELMGLSLKNVEVTLYHKDKEIYKDFGEMLFTHFGVSGPLILSASCKYVQKAFKEPALLTIDLKPALSEEQLDKRILRDFEEELNRNFANSLDKLLPKSLIPVVVSLSGIARETKVNQISREQRATLVNVIKHLRLNVTSFRPLEEAIVTSGGIKVSEIDPSNMASKLVSGLFFAGEIIDVDAFTGGFNLQIAWATGYAAGMAAGAAEKE